jgi:hypothetical protein
MKKLEDFECEKVEIKTVYGGGMAGCQTWTSVRGQDTNDYDGDDKC